MEYEESDVLDLSPEQATAKLLNLMDTCGITIESAFVPVSQSRNRDQKHLTLNWKVTVAKKGVPILLADYSAGCGHIPGYRVPFARERINVREFIREICESGRYPSGYGFAVGREDSGVRRWTGTLKPEAADVFGCLVMDSNVLEYSAFDEWAGDYGYDPDSRSAESIYRTCLEHALKLRAALGDKLLGEARELANQQ